MADLMFPGGGLTNSKLAAADAATGDVLSGKKFYSGNKLIKTGSMPNKGAWGTTINPGGSVKIPKGWHNGLGKVSARGGGSWPLRHKGFTGDNVLRSYTVGAPDGEGTYVWVFEGIISSGNENTVLEFHFFDKNFGPARGEKNNYITSGSNNFTASTTVRVCFWGGFADLWYIRIA